MKKAQVEGRIKAAEGKLKEVTGRIVGNATLDAKGKLERSVGKVRAGPGAIKQEIKKARRKFERAMLPLTRWRAARTVSGLR